MFIHFVGQYLVNAFSDYLITPLLQDNVSMLNTGVLSRGVLLLQQEVVHLQDLILQGLDLDDFSLFFSDLFVFSFLLEEKEQISG